MTARHLCAKRWRTKRINPSGRKQVTARGPNQKLYLEAIEKYDIVFGIGPAGTGKTFLAVAMAVQYLMSKRVNRIVLARPAVEAGEKLGFLPGDLQDKVDPYLRPLYDALFDLVDYERVTKFIEKRVIEVAPLAFMRGRTLGDAFVILDEAQNTTSEQMKMFLTRIGFGSKAVITGDVTQIDLPSGRKSGLVEAQRVVSGIEGISFIHFDERDVVRHPLVQMIIKAYDDTTRRSTSSHRRDKETGRQGDGRQRVAFVPQEIEVINRQRIRKIDKDRVIELSRAALDRIGRTEAVLTVTFIRDRAMRRLNRDYRGIDGPTDVLSFAYHERRSAGDQ